MTEQSRAGPGAKLPWRTLAVLCLGSFAVLMDTTIVNVAVPDLIVELHAGLDHVLWIGNSYLLVFGALLITMSRLGDIFGPRKLFVLGLVVFGVSSALCGVTRNPGELIAARALQGLGAAMLSPQPLVIISAIFPARRRGAALGLYTSMIGFAAVLGPTIGGLLVTYAGWRWIFFVNVPIVAAGVALSLRLVPDLRLGRRHRIDFAGVALVTLGLLAVVFGLIEGGRYDWGRIAGSWLSIPELITGGVVLLIVFGLWEWRQRDTEPLLPSALFRDPAIVLLCLLTALVQFALISQMILSGLNLQSVLGMSAVVAGLASLPLTVSLAGVAPFAGRLSDRVGSWKILAFGFTVYSAGMAALAAVLSLDATPLTFVLPFALLGVGMGCLLAPLTTEALRRSPPESTGALSGTLNTARQLGSLLGSAVIGAVLANRLTRAMQDLAARDAGRLPEAVRPSFLDAFGDVGRGGLRVGHGQSGGAEVPPGLPGPLADQVRTVIHGVFTRGYVDAMRFTLVIPSGLLLLGAVSCLVFLRSPRTPARPGEVAPEPRIAAVPER
jgi:EmrB/QacA subfamily drug resistance transporter